MEPLCDILLTSKNCGEENKNNKILVTEFKYTVLILLNMIVCNGLDLEDSTDHLWEKGFVGMLYLARLYPTYQLVD